MAKPPLIVCSQCGAQCLAEAPQCWLCRADLASDSQIVLAEVVPQPPSSASEWFFGISTVLVGLFVLLVGLGIFLDEVGLGLGYFVVVTPAFIATVVRAQRQRKRDGTVTWANRFVTLLLSLSITGGIVGLLIVAAIAAVFVICLVEGPKGFH